ncbi:hypothetical protein LO749_01485 [Paracoccus denitrificans]|uniref:hypothetical protein n=1 Tax=Paracoccus denitrificans TaxID=266 RepID=UPI001E370690|nr:hypothetical protein [Paracoccus denitrificans]UFS65267.1 hypothetical protein LO749_01485 [Paracoccus denitrificans]
MAQTRLHINTGVDLSGRGLPPVMPPFPSLEGALYAAYCPGQNYGALATDPVAARYGARYDWSGGGRHLSTLGGVTINDWYMSGKIGADVPYMPINGADLVAAGGGDYTLVAIAQSSDSALTISLLRNGGANPTAFLMLNPMGLNGLALADMRVEGVSHQAVVDNIGADRARIGIYAGVWTPEGRTIYHSGPTGPLRSGTHNEPVPTTSAGNYYIGIESAGSGTEGINRIYGVGLYAKALSAAEVAFVQESFRAWHEAAESGLVI